MASAPRVCTAGRQCDRGACGRQGQEWQTPVGCYEQPSGRRLVFEDVQSGGDGSFRWRVARDGGDPHVAGCGSSEFQGGRVVLQGQVRRGQKEGVYETKGGTFRFQLTARCKMASLPRTVSRGEGGSCRIQGASSRSWVYGAATEMRAGQVYIVQGSCWLC